MLSKMIDKTNCILFFLALVITLPAGINTSQSWGSIASPDAPLITLNVKDEPLKAVFEKIHRATGYQISIDEQWAGFLVTASIKDASLNESIRRVLADLNHAIIRNDIEKKLTIYIYDRGLPATNQKRSDAFDRQVVDYRDLEVIPPDKPGGRGITQRELDDILASENAVDPLDVEVIPPQNPGEKGVTQSELDDILASENAVDPLDVEVIPPQHPGEKGITQRELNAILAREKRGDPLDREVITPPPSGNPNH